MGRYHFDNKGIVSAEVKVVTKSGMTWIAEITDIEGHPASGSLSLTDDSRVPTLQLCAIGRLTRWRILRNGEDADV